MSVRRVESLTLVLSAIGLIVSSAGPQGAEPGPLDVLSYGISMEIGPEATAYRASTRITFEVTRQDTDRVRFDLVSLTVDSVRVDGVRGRFERGPESLQVELGRVAGGGDTIAVEVFYHGAPRDGLIFRRNRYGRATVFADNWPNRARYWFPAIDHPSDKARVEFRVRTPPEWRVVANGRLLDELLAGDGRKLTVWATDRPIPVYTMVVGAGRLSVRDVGSLGCGAQSQRCVRITQWVYPEDEDRATLLFQRAPAMVAFYDSLIGPFPYEKLALVQSSSRFGGMENSSAIFFGDALPSGRVGELLVAHEIVHQWFGDAVTERDWPHLWLSEGFATYFASVFFEFTDGDTMADRVRAEAERRYVASVPDVGRPVLDGAPADLMELLNRNNYQKGAWVLHMLRGVVGDEAFFEGIRRYYARFRDGTALTDDFRRVMEKTSRQQLSWFFDQWLRRPGYPMVEVRPSWREDEKILELRVEQVQPWPAFRFPLEIEVEHADSAVSRVFWVEAREGGYTWSMPEEPDRVRADPDNVLLGPAEVIP
jgi:aminopeptidase N